MTVDPITAAWFAAMFGDCPADETIAVTSVGAGMWKHARTVFVPCAELEHAAGIVKAAPLNVYVGVATRRPDLSSGRGGLADVRHTSTLWADIDWADPGHATPAGQLRHPADRQACLDLVASVAPAPTMTVTTGGGIHAYWRLTGPLELDDAAKTLTAAWVARIASLAALRGLHVDSGVGNADRVLRPPGSTRSKKGSKPFRCWLEATEPGAGYGLDRQAWRPGPAYHVDALADIVDNWQTKTKAEAKVSASAPTPRRDTAPARTSDGGLSPLDVLTEAVQWADILEHYGYTHVGAENVAGEPVDLWRRPGDPSSEYSLKTWRNKPVAVVWSDACGLPVGAGQKLTKARVVAHLEGLTESELAATLLREARAKVGRR